MKKNKILLASLAIALTLNLTSCSKDDEALVVPTTIGTNVTATNALVDGQAATSTETPAMSDKTAVLKTTAGTFEMEFASKPTESGTYTVKSSLSAARDLVAAPVKEVTFKYTSKDNILYKATNGEGGTVTITIKDGKILIDISNISVCYNEKCKKVSVKYDFSYTPPTTTVDPVKPDPVKPDPVKPDPVKPNPTTGDSGTGYVDGTASISTFGSGMWVNNAIVFNTATGSFQIWFKQKPTTAGVYSVKGQMTVILGQGGINDASFAFVPTSGSQYWSTDTSSGTIEVKEDGNFLIIEAKNIKASVNGTTNSKTFSAFYKVAK